MKTMGSGQQQTLPFSDEPIAEPIGASAVHSIAQMSPGSSPKSLSRRLNGRFYTHEVIGRYLSREVGLVIGKAPSPRRTVVDPFAGDGRLVSWLLEETQEACSDEEWSVELWDSDSGPLREAARAVEATATRLGRRVSVQVRCWDTFEKARSLARRFGVVITNPPWEQVKPDRRDLLGLPQSAREEYVSALKGWSSALARAYPASAPAKRFAGWGMNLARVGTEIALQLTTEDGVCAIVSPASFLADTNSETLRREMFARRTIVAVGHFPAEARLFDGVDVPCIAFVACSGLGRRGSAAISRFDSNASLLERRPVRVDRGWLEANGWVLPVAFGAAGIELLRGLAHLPCVQDEELSGRIWAGRELDETNKERYLLSRGEHPFLKGVNVRRFGLAQEPATYVDVEKVRLPKSVAHPRLVWRDVSRPTQKRRLHATLIPPGWVTGNSLGVAHLRSSSKDVLHSLAALLGVFNSMVFEYQLRNMLSTGHISLSSVRRVRLPRLSSADEAKIAEMTLNALESRDGAEPLLEVAVAHAYGLDESGWALIVDSYTRLAQAEREALRSAWEGR
jgi:Alw26I/Eco31I/Esp3I family type II restriction m6 adenine DNA methyltransferase